MSAVGVATGVAAVGGLWALDRVANAVVRPVPRAYDRPDADPGVEQHDVLIPSGRQELAGWLLGPSEPRGRPLVLLVHGWGAHYGILFQLARPLVAAGHPVLLFDVRGHGRNEEVPYVTARHFREDIQAAVAWAARRFPDRRRVVVGHSMGGGAAVLAAAEGAPVDGLVLVATPADILEATAAYLDSRGFPGRLMVVALRPFWWLRVGGGFGPLTPERRLREVEAPVLIVHPELDGRVPVEHARRLLRSARPGGARLQVVSGAGHADILGDARLQAHLLDFLGELP